MWFIVSIFLIKTYRVDIYKVIIAIGTFSLALAFAGNDLVNFIGVPIAAIESYNGWISSNINSYEYSMDILSEKVNTKPIYLLISGLIMVITLWFSSKARNVVKTSLDLSDQNNVDEKFMSSIISFIFLYILIFFIVTALLSINGLDFITAISAAATSISNVGPGLGEIIGPNGNFSQLTDFSKWILSISMILGRLELFAVLVLFIPSFWRKY